MPFELDPSPSQVPVSPYIIWDEFVNRFGWMNIVKASNKDGYQVTANGSVQQIDNPKTPNYFAVQDSFNYASEKVDSELMGGVLQIPLDFTPNGGEVPIRVRRWAMIIAFCDLLNMRNPDKSVKRIRTTSGWKTESAGGDSMGSQLEEVLMDIAMHKHGQWRQMPEAKHATSATPGVAAPLHRFGMCRMIDGVPLFYGYLAAHAIGLDPSTQWGSSSDDLNVTGSDVYST
jgi:hypothetical protein